MVQKRGENMTDSDGLEQLIDLLCVPCATCGCPHDDRVWVGHFESGAYIAQCPDCYDKEHPFDIDLWEYREYLNDIRIAGIEKSQMRLWA